MRGLYSEGLIYGGKFAFQNRLGKSIVGRKFTVFALFYFVFEGNFPSTSPQGAYIWRDDLTEGFLGYRFGGLIHGGAYSRNCTVSVLFTTSQILPCNDLSWHNPDCYCNSFDVPKQALKINRPLIFICRWTF